MDNIKKNIDYLVTIILLVMCLIASFWLFGYKIASYYAAQNEEIASQQTNDQRTNDQRTFSDCLNSETSEGRMVAGRVEGVYYFDPTAPDPSVSGTVLAAEDCFNQFSDGGDSWDGEQYFSL